MATEICGTYCFENVRVFISTRCAVKVKSVDEGIVIVIPPKNCNNFEIFISTLVGCLEKQSNFLSIFYEFYKEEVKGFEFFWKGFDYLITPSTDIDTIKKAFFRHNALQQKMEYRRLQVHKKIIEVDDTTEIQFKDDYAEMRWNQIVANAESEDELKAVTFTRRYAKIMQYLIIKNGIDNFGHFSASIMDAISKDGIINTNILKFAFSVLRKIWIYGNAF